MCSISNNDSDDGKSDTEVINQDNPVIANNEGMAVVIPDSQQVSLRDALEVVLLFDRGNLPLSHFIEGSMEAKAMLPTPAAQENLARLLRGKLSVEARNSRLRTKGGMVAIVTRSKCTHPSVARAVFARVTSLPRRSRYTRRFVSKLVEKVALRANA